MNREIYKGIFNRSKLMNKYWKQPNKEKTIAYKKHKNNLVKIRRRSIKLIGKCFPNKYRKK